MDDFIEANPEIDELVTQILALKKGCFLLHTTHSCQSLSDSLFKIKMKLIKELAEKYQYTFDAGWQGSLIKIQRPGKRKYRI